MKLGQLAIAIAFAALAAGAAAARADTTLVNKTSESITVYWQAWGCTDIVDGRTYVCHSQRLDPEQSASYTFAGGTSGRGIDASCSGNNMLDTSTWSTYVHALAPNNWWNGDGSAYFTDGSSGCSKNDGAPPALRHVDSWIDVGDGWWGTWRLQALCPAGTYATGYQLRAEPNQYSGDDSALNSVELSCSYLTPNLQSAPGYWGAWTPAVQCPAGNYLAGAKIQIEPQQGAGDDSGADDVVFTCDTGATLGHADTGVPATWGTWSEVTSCPSGQKVCGLQIRLEEQQGSGDDSAMNGLKLACCK